MYFSIIIPTLIDKNRTLDRLLLTLKGFENQKYLETEYEVIVVIDGLHFDVEDEVRKHIKSHNIIFLKKEHSGMCSAINYAVQYAQGKYLLIGVDDNIPQSNMLDTYYQVIQEDLRENVAFISREYFLNHVTGIKNLFTGDYFRGVNKVEYEERYFNDLSAFPTISLNDIPERYDDLLMISEEPDTYKQFDQIVEEGDPQLSWLCLRPGFLMMTKSFFIKIKGMDTNFDPTGCYSDLEFGYRLVKEGGEVRYVKNTSFIHLNHINFNINPNIEWDCLKYMSQKYDSKDLLMLPFLWLNTDIKAFVYLKNRIKDLL